MYQSWITSIPKAAFLDTEPHLHIERVHENPARSWFKDALMEVHRIRNSLFWHFHLGGAHWMDPDGTGWALARVIPFCSWYPTNIYGGYFYLFHLVFNKCSKCNILSRFREQFICIGGIDFFLFMHANQWYILASPRKLLSQLYLLHFFILVHFWCAGGLELLTFNTLLPLKEREIY